MLLSLRIRDFAIIDDASLSFERGFTVLSGETGAGKSIVVGALSLLLGERSRADLVRSGASRAVVEGSFAVPGMRQVTVLLEEAGVPAVDGEVLVLRREVSAGGGSRAWVNDFNVSVATLGALGAHLVSLHGQHESRALMYADSQRDVLDEFAGATEVASQLMELSAELGELRRRRVALAEARDGAATRLAHLRELVADVTALAPRHNELESLDMEITRLAGAAEVIAAAESVLSLLSDDDVGVLALLHRIRRQLDGIARGDPAAPDFNESLAAAIVQLQEFEHDVERYRGGVAVDPERLALLESRRSELLRTSRRHGIDSADLLEHAESAQREILELESADHSLLLVDGETAAMEARIAATVAELSRLRARGGDTFARRVSDAISHLGLPDAAFSVALDRKDRPDATGAEEVRFMVALNAGHEPRDLARVASGGELSRLMLAAKEVLAGAAYVPTLVFDEVDAGIGGAVALRVGDALRSLADRHQVLVVTHLPQIAAKAHAHFAVRKSVDGGVTRVHATLLTGEDRVAEVARMLAGDAGSATALRHAAELLADR